MASENTFRVTLQPGGQGFVATAGTSLLQAALDAGFALPHACRSGACGSCKARVISGEIDHGAALDSALSDAERAAGMALLCCASARSDLTLECREAEPAGGFPVRIMPCRVQRLERVADDVIVLTLKLPGNEDFQFLAGQYIEFLLKEGKRRAFSIANSPDAARKDKTIELHIRRIEGGEFTGQVFDGMKEKDILRFQGPHGGFFLREESAKPVVLVAGGTGFAPVKAIVEHALLGGCPRPIALYRGARNRAGLYLPTLAEGWAAGRPGLSYVPVLSEPAPDDNWSGRTGLVHRAVLDDLPDLSGHQAYVCGAPAMVDAARTDFMAVGLPAEEFFADAFGFAAA